jgi:hypothetical protein
MANRLFPLFLMLAAPALAGDLAGADAVRAAISGNTVQGGMQASGAYTEYYSADGTIRARDYTGRWSIEGDAMCFAYGEDPATCWGVRLEGSSVTWVGDGGDEGNGTILSGNPNGF